MPDQTGRILQFDSPLGAKAVAVTALSGHERLNGLFSFKVTLLSEKDPVKSKDLLGQDVKVTIDYAGLKRDINGVVCEFQERDPYGDNTFEYDVVVVPKLWLLGLSSHHRIFENMDAPAIIEEVVTSGCGMGFSKKNMKSYRKREICCQYGETDLAFVLRLMAEEGIGFCFDDDGKKLLLSGAMMGFPNCSPLSHPYNERDNSQWKERVSRFKPVSRMSTGKLISVDYGEYSPSAPLEVEAQSSRPSKHYHGEMEMYGRHDFESPGSRILPRGSCQEQVTRWLDGLEADGEEFVGVSGAAPFTAGHLFKLQDTPVSSDGQKDFLLVEVVHSAAEGYDQEAFYSNNFRCVAKSNTMAFTPDPPVDVPRVWGPHTAKVEEVRNPEEAGSHAEVKVKFPWEGEKTSCWARVAQLYAGNKWGGFFVPDVGQEVVVEFINGDPDRPLVVGAVYNKDNKIPPYTKWQSGIKTRSNEYNELRFDDNPGSEEVYFQAGKDHNFLVKNDEKGEVKNDQEVKIGNNQKVDVGNNVEYKAGQKITIEAGMEIVLKVGGSTIKVDNKGVEISGTMIKVSGNASTEVSGSGMLTLKGGLVKIN